MIPDNENTIDVADVKFKDIPVSLDGEVLLERTLDNNGNVSGYLTIPIDKLMTMKGKTEEELITLGWGKYKHILNSF